MTDFVVLWVDGSDVNWLEEKKKYDDRALEVAASAARYRDWNNMQYWFRGIEKFAPWVNRVFFVTWGHTPSWLDPDHPKLRIVNHRDFIPEEYLPTYNSNTIELNLHRIPELSEQFVLFNDDMFLIDHVKETDFFISGKPCDEFVMNPVIPLYNMPIIGHTNVNNVSIINRYFDKKKVTKQLFTRVYNPGYGTGMGRNIMLSAWPKFTGFYNHHIPLAHLKSTFSELWDKEPEMLDNTCRNRFRTYEDLNHWLMRYWNLCSGQFVPRKKGFGRMFTVGNDNRELVRYIREQRGKTVCVNDSSSTFDFDPVVNEINRGFEALLPEKSRYEL